MYYCIQLYRKRQPRTSINIFYGRRGFTYRNPSYAYGFMRMYIAFLVVDRQAPAALLILSII